jgi:hypothetical protein
VYNSFLAIESEPALTRIFFALLLSLTSVVHAQQNQERLRIVVRPSAGEGTVRNAYVSVVPPHRPWARPVVESIARDGVAIVAVPAGEYRIVAGAPGSGVAVQGPLTVSPGTPRDVEIRLPLLRAVTGTVRDESGRPLGGVTISDINAVVEAPLGRMSELARKHLAGEWKTVSADDGTWSLPVPSASGRPLTAEAVGYSVGWSNDGKDGAIAFVLTPGARLQVRLNHADPAWAVTLAARGETISVPPPWQGQLWARRALTPLLAWPSLPAGTYDIYAQQIDPRSFGKATKLGSVVLEPRTTRELVFEMPAAEAAPKEIASFFLDRLSRTALSSLEVAGRDTAGAPRKVSHALEEASAGTLIHLNTTGRSAPFYGYTTDRFIAMTDDVVSGPPDTLHSADVMERADAGLHVRSGDPSLAIPGAGVALFHQCGSAATITVPVEVKKDGTVLFPAPADCRGLRLAFDPFGPLTLAKSLKAGSTTEWLGEFTLYAAGGAGVHVVMDGGAPVDGGSVGIHAQTAARGDAVPIATKSTRADGWAYFDDLPAGRELYAIAITSGGQQSPPHRFHVRPREQTLVDPLILSRPATLVVRPELDAEFVKTFPKSRIELLILDPENPVSRQEQRRESVGERQSIELKELQPGRWQITALISTGSTMQPVRGDSVELDPGASKEIVAKFKPLVFRGHILAHGTGVKGNIDIIGPRRSDVVPSVASSASGEFTALLQRPDTYLVGVRTSDPLRVMWIGDVDFTDPVLPVELTAPEHQIVAVVRADSRPVRNVAVTARLQRDGSSGLQSLETMPAMTGANGEADLEGILAGVWTVTALDEGGRLAEKRVSVAGREPVRVELELAPSRSISGTVREAFGAPVSGARVACVIPSANGPAVVLETASAADGTFTIEGSGSVSSSALCSVTSFFGSDGYRVAAGPATLMLPALPASLQVLSLPPINRMAALWLVSDDGRLIDVSPYVTSSGGTAVLRVPAVAPSHWKLVRVASLADWVTLTNGSASLLSPIVDVTLNPGDKKTVNLHKE